MASIVVNTSWPPSVIGSGIKLMKARLMLINARRKRKTDNPSLALAITCATSMSGPPRPSVVRLRKSLAKTWKVFFVRSIVRFHAFFMLCANDCGVKYPAALNSMPIFPF